MKKTVGFLLFDGVEELDFVGPWEVFSIWKNQFQGPENIISISQNGLPIQCVNRLSIMTDYRFDNAPALDYLIVPGGYGTRTEDKNEHLLNFIREQHKSCLKVLSVCTGALLLAAAGLLDHGKATTHFLSLDLLKSYENVTVVQERMVNNDKIMTSAGITAGIDLALAFIAETAGEAVAAKIQRHMEYFPNKIYGELAEHQRYLKYL